MIYPLVALLWIYFCLRVLGLVRWSTNHRKLTDSFIVMTLISAVFALLWNWSDIQYSADEGLYPGDSIYTLSPILAIALAGFTTVLLLFAGYASWSVTRVVLARVPATKVVMLLAVIVNGMLVLILYWVALSLVPQLYYTIYLQIFPNLPSQLVVKGLIPIKEFIGLLVFSEKPSLSNHAAGLLGWILIVNAAMQWLYASRSRSQTSK